MFNNSFSLQNKIEQNKTNDKVSRVQDDAFQLNPTTEFTDIHSDESWQIISSNKM